MSYQRILGSEPVTERPRLSIPPDVDTTWPTALRRGRGASRQVMDLQRVAGNIAATLIAGGQPDRSYARHVVI